MPKYKDPHRFLKFRKESDCDHTYITDIGTKYVEHTMCLDCHHHWYEGKEFTREQWDDYVEIPEGAW